MNRLDEASTTYETASGFASTGERKQLAGIYGFEGVGDAYINANQKTKAEKAYQRALELDPGNGVISQKLAKARTN
jgi:predicted negative regulator of RcsB-dependent stress response